MSYRIAYQGEAGAYSEQALALLRGDAVAVPCASFAELFAAISEGLAQEIFAPVENTLAGAVTDSVDLAMRSGLHIRGEAVMRIRHQLIGVPGSKLADIEVARSHPVALRQCRKFLAAHPRMRPTPAPDTAGSVRELMESGDTHAAAIASARAAELYGAAILAADIEDAEHNYTRFLLLGAQSAPPSGSDKGTALLSGDGSMLPRVCHLADSVGVTVVNVVSRPAAEEPWRYHLWMDFVGEPGAIAELEVAISRSSADARWLGSYGNALPKLISSSLGEQAESIGSLRREIDGTDRGLVRLLNQRAMRAQRIGRLKEASGLPIYEPQREKTIFENVSQCNAGPLPSSELHRIFERIIDVMRSIQRSGALPHNHFESQAGKQVKP